MQVRKGGVWRTITSARVRRGGAWRTVQQIQEYFDGQWREVANLVSGSSDEMSVEIRLPSSGATVTGGSATQSLNSIKAVPRDGLAPYTYSWEVLSDDGPGSVAVDEPTVARTDIFATFSSSTGTITATVRCTVTDALGTTADETADLTFIRT